MSFMGGFLGDGVFLWSAAFFAVLSGGFCFLLALNFTKRNCGGVLSFHSFQGQLGRLVLVSGRRGLVLHTWRVRIFSRVGRLCVLALEKIRVILLSSRETRRKHNCNQPCGSSLYTYAHSPLQDHSTHYRAVLLVRYSHTSRKAARHRNHIQP